MHHIFVEIDDSFPKMRFKRILKKYDCEMGDATWIGNDLCSVEVISESPYNFFRLGLNFKNELTNVNDVDQRTDKEGTSKNSSPSI